MKSKLFSRFNLADDRNQSFSNDLKSFIALDEKTTDILVSSIVDFSSLRYTYERNQFSERLSKEKEIDLSIIKNSLNVLDFLQSKIVDNNFQGDTIELWISDLREQKLLDDSNAQKFTISITKLWTNATDKFLEISRKQRYMSRVFPSLKSMDHSVELRGVYKDEYQLSCDIACYEPSFIDVIPIISVNIVLDSGMPKEISFQASPDDIKNLINEMNAALSESTQLLNSIRFKK